MDAGDAEHNLAVINEISARVSLSPLPQNKFDLWREGIGRRKPAGHFFFSELVCIKCEAYVSPHQDFAGYDVWTHITKPHSQFYKLINL